MGEPGWAMAHIEGTNRLIVKVSYCNAGKIRKKQKLCRDKPI
jgi:hypothetical protein